MTIGDRVTYKTYEGKTLEGIITDLVSPRCKCKGSISKWVIKTDERIIKVSFGDKNLNLYKIEPKQSSLSFNFK